MNSILFSLVALMGINFADVSELNFYSGETESFEITSNDKEQKQYLIENIEHIKKAVYNRWGLKNIKFNKKCVIVCVNDLNVLKKHLKTNRTVYSPSFTRQNGEVVPVIWTYMKDDWRNSDLPSVLTEACIHEYSLQNKMKFPRWLIRGMAILNGSEQSIYSVLSTAPEMFQDGFTHYEASDILLNKTDITEYNKWFDLQSVMLCLFLKKEFPGKNIMQFCNSVPLVVVKDEYNFSSYDEFNYQFERFAFNLSGDVKSKKLPKTYYLNIFTK